MFDAAPIMDRWIEALESGEHEQFHGSFRSSDRKAHCALGLLAKVAGIPIKDPRDPRADNYTGVKEILEPYGLTASQIYDLNDDKRMTFPQIAAWLRNRV